MSGRALQDTVVDEADDSWYVPLSRIGLVYLG